MPSKLPRVSFVLSEEEYQAVKRYKVEYKIKNMSQAYISLISHGLDLVRSEQINKNVNQNAIQKNHQEISLIEKYRSLDDHGKETVDYIIEREKQRTDQITTANASREESPELAFPIVYNDPAAAGSPLYAESGYDHIELPADRLPAGTDFGVRISGESMEPTIPDGCIVWIHKTEEVPDGQIGVFMVDDSAVCKRVEIDEDGFHLVSDNSAYGPVELHEFTSVLTVGRVLGYYEE